MTSKNRTETVKKYNQSTDTDGNIIFTMTEETEDIIITTYYADDGKYFVDKNGFKLGNIIELGTEDSIDNYTEK